jgi:cold shock CspA family protein
MSKHLMVRGRVGGTPGLSFGRLSRYGVIRFWNAERRYGFIVEDGGDSIFFHGGSLDSDDYSPKVGDAVEYRASIEPRRNSRCAQGVRLLV